MRTTLPLDEDVAAKLSSASCKSGKPFEQVVNAARQADEFAVQPQRMGALKAGLTLDKTSAVLEEADGPHQR
jgi:hypothetical protein